MTDSYNDGYTHEALHITFILMETFENYVLETLCADQFPDVKELAEKAHQALFNLYQLIGTKFSEERIVPTPDGPKGYTIVSGNWGLGQRPVLTAGEEVSAQADIKRMHGSSDGNQVAVGEDFFVTQAKRLGVAVEEVKFGKGVRQTPLAPATPPPTCSTGEYGEKIAEMGVQFNENGEPMSVPNRGPLHPEYAEPWVLATARADALLPAAVRDILYVRWTKDFLILEPAITAAEMFQVRRVLDDPPIQQAKLLKSCASLYDPAGEYFVLRVAECPPADRTFWPTVPAEVSQADHESLTPWQRGLYAKDYGSGRWRLRPEHQAWSGA